MKTKKLPGVLLIFLLAACFYSCRDSAEETVKPITLEYDDPQFIFNNEKRNINLTPFSDPTRPLQIKGGDGHYKVTNTNEDVVRVNYNGETIRFQPVGTGTASIEIEDTSGRLYLLTIRVDYLTHTYPVYLKKYIVQGDNLTLGEKSKLEKAIEAADPTTKYVFTFTDKENTQGTVRFYTQPLETGPSYREYTFKNELVELADESAPIIGNGYKLTSYNRLTIQSEKENILLYITKDISSFLSSKAEQIPLRRYCIIEDLTEEYKEAYPATEHIYKIHVVTFK